MVAVTPVSANMGGGRGVGDERAVSGYDFVVVGQEFHAGEGNGVGYSDCAGGGFKDCDLAAPGGVDHTARIRPIGVAGGPVAAAAINHTVADNTRAVPILVRAGRSDIATDDKIDISSGRRERVAEARRQRAERQPVVGQCAAIGDERVGAVAERCPAGNVEDAVQSEVAADCGEVVDAAAHDIGRVELIAQHRRRMKREIAVDDDRTVAVARREMGAVRYRHRAADRAGAPQRRAGIDRQIAA